MDLHLDKMRFDDFIRRGQVFSRERPPADFVSMMRRECRDDALSAVMLDVTFYQDRHKQMHRNESGEWHIARLGSIGSGAAKVAALVPGFVLKDADGNPLVKSDIMDPRKRAEAVAYARECFNSTPADRERQSLAYTIAKRKESDSNVHAAIDGVMTNKMQMDMSRYVTGMCKQDRIDAQVAAEAEARRCEDIELCAASPLTGGR